MDAPKSTVESRDERKLRALEEKHRHELMGDEERLEAERENVAAQCSYALALERGDHPEVLEAARRENAADSERLAEHFAEKPA